MNSSRIVRLLVPDLSTPRRPSCSLSRADQHVLESKLSLETQCIKLESSVQHLRLTNAGLEKASEAR